MFVIVKSDNLDAERLQSIKIKLQDKLDKGTPIIDMGKDDKISIYTIPKKTNEDKDNLIITITLEDKDEKLASLLEQNFQTRFENSVVTVIALEPGETLEFIE